MPKITEMISCIYCKKSLPEVTFNNREHIIPQLLGKFAPHNLYFQGNTVCDECNKEFSKLETIFAEDSWEGVLSAMYGIRKTKTIRRKDRLKTSISSNCDLGIFKNMLPFVSPEDQKAYPKPQVQMKDKNEVYQIILMEEIVKIKEGTREFQRKKEWIGNLNQKGIRVVGNKKFPPERIVSIMKKFGVRKKEFKPKYCKNIGNQLYVHFQGRIDDTILRVPAKIAFNYFAYCANQSKMNHILFEKEFDNIRDYITHGKYNGERPVLLTNESILYDEKNSEKVRLVHLVCFMQENNKIISKVSLLGRFTYKIILGNNPFRISYDPKKFGCGTCFNPFSQEIMRLSSIPYFLITPDKYELFCR